MINNPNEIIAVKRTTSTLGVSAFFSEPDKETSPLKNSPYDRFEFVYLDSGDKTAVKGNMKITDVALFKMRLQSSVDKIVNKEIAESSGGGKSTPAFTVPLTGSYKGKTVAQILTEKPSEKAGLLNAKKWLEDNLSRYAGNAKMISAIDEGIELLEKGELVAPVDNTKFVVYEGDTKYYRQKKNDKGHHLCHKLTINFESSRNYPYTVVIENFYAPVENKAIKLSEKYDVITKKMHCTADEIVDIARKMDEAQLYYNFFIGAKKWQAVLDAQFKPE